MADVRAVITETGIRLFNDHGALFVSVSDGQAVIHDLVGDGKDGATMFALVAEAERALRQAGFDHVLIHVDFEAERLLDVYMKRWGLKPVAVVLRKDLN